MSSEFNKTLKYNHGERSLKNLLIIPVDFKCLQSKMYTCEKHPEESYTENIAKHEPSGY